MENLQQVGEGYERAMKLLRIKEITDFLTDNEPNPKDQW